MSSTVRVTFEPEGKSVEVDEGSPLHEAARFAEVGLENPCGGLGICGKCKVEYVRGLPEPTQDEMRLLTKHEVSGRTRLSCRQKVQGETVIFVPEGSRSLVQQILCGGEQRDVTLSPGIRKVSVTVPKPALTDQRSDADRLLSVLNLPEARFDFETLRILPTVLRQQDFSVTVVLVDNTIIALEPGDTTTRKYGIAFDIGTTTVVGYLMDLNNGIELSSASALNGQIPYGDDLIARLNHCIEKPNGQRELHRAIVKVVNALLKEACESVGVNPEHVYALTAVGNTCMSHLFLNIDPKPLAYAPYVPAVKHSVQITARQLGLKICPAAPVWVLPNIGSYVGADTVAVLLAHMWEGDGKEETCMAVDIGTNGEVVLHHKGKWLGCSAAAGPAFEGAGILCGMRGAPGAVSYVKVNEHVAYTTVDGKPPRGICGSGLIDAVAQMLDAGLITTTGRIKDRSQLNGVSSAVKERLVEVEGSRPHFVLVPQEESATGEAIFLTQKDIGHLQLAKGSIHAAMETLMNTAGVKPEDISTLYLAGGFGNYLRVESAARIGLFPPIPLDRIRPVGNAAGVGSKLALLSSEERCRAEEIAGRVEHVELALNPDYFNNFTEASLFPEG
ncbi:MAG: DUF4445 domain-containing protein [Armatimonadetes bacterium]|nr:DUF4445 domain-containing protein [Armatimonadota bacterium]